MEMDDVAPHEAEVHLVGGDDLPDEENRDDYIGLLLYETQKTREGGGRLNQLPA
jgi:hypothetical protein